MDEVSESVSKMACKNCGKPIIKGNVFFNSVWKHDDTGSILCQDQDRWSGYAPTASPEQAMSS